MSLKIFDFLGREVAALVNEEMKPGSYNVTWDAAGFSSGTYFCYIKLQNECAGTSRMPEICFGPCTERWFRTTWTV